MYGELILHADGSCDVLAVIGSHRDDGALSIWQTSIVFSVVASLQVAGLHAMRAGASGDAMLAAAIVLPDEERATASLISARSGFIAQVPGSYSVTGTTTRRTISLDEVSCAAGAALASYDLASDLLGAFGSPEPIELSREGVIQPHFIYGDDKIRASQWARRNDVVVADSAT